MLDGARLHQELAGLHQRLAKLASSRRGKGLVDVLHRAIGGTTEALLWQPLHADCVRIVYCALAADGDVSDGELAEVHDVLAAAARSYAAIIPADYSEFAALDRASAHNFLDRYAADLGPFGRGATVQWPGLALCRRAAELGEPAALEGYRRVMTRLIKDACQIGRVTVEDPRWRGRIDEIDGLIRTLQREAEIDPSTVDRRVQAFLAPSNVFHAVQQATSIFENDPFDVASMHRDAHKSFEQIVERARLRSPAGQMLLVKGESGCGKTHLLRGFRRHVQEHGRGFILYAQLQSATPDYERYLLQRLVDSLSRPYSSMSGQRTGLRELATGLVQLASPEVQARAKCLTEDTVPGRGSVADYVDELVEMLCRERELSSFDLDLLRVVLYALRPDPCVTSAVYKYLRCEDMNARDRKWIGDAVARTRDDDPHSMILNLGRLAALTRRALVIMVDQVDLAGFDSSSTVIFRRAIDALYHITSELASSVAVIACLSDLYETVRAQLNQPAIDRLENNPPVSQLKLHRNYQEIVEVVGRRLACLFTEHGTVQQPETPVYPIPEALLRELENRRIRDVLAWCHEYQRRCTLAGKILDSIDGPEIEVTAVAQGDADLDAVAAAWNDAMLAAGIDIPDKEQEILDAVSVAIQACADENALTLAPPKLDRGVLQIALSSASARAELSIAVTNANYHRGAFAGQIESLRTRALQGTPVSIRTLEFPRGEVSDRVLAQLTKAGGRRVYLDPSTIRTLAAFRRFRATFPADRMIAWQRRDCPISSLAPVAALLDLERLRASGPMAAEALALPSVILAPETVETPLVGGVEVTRAVRSPRPKKRAPTTPGGACDAAAPAAAVSQSAAASVSASIVRQPAAAMSRFAPAVSQRAMVSAPAVVSVSPTAMDPESLAPEAVEKFGRIAGTEQTRRGGITHPPRVARMPPVPPVPKPIARSAAPAGPARPPTDPKHLLVGASTGFESSEPRMLELAALSRHVGILGGPGSGKTTLALNLVEQALERDIAVILLDRRGDLAGYARSDWWQRAADPERGLQLAERIDVRLFTPGGRSGRPLAVPVVPDLALIPESERDRVVQAAAASLASVLHAAGGVDEPARLAILHHAISLLAARSQGAGLSELAALIEQQDDTLVARTARARCYSDERFHLLAGELAAIQHSAPGLFDPSAEALTADTLIGQRRDGKVPLAIVSTKFLGEVPRMQAWVAELVACLGRFVAKPPGKDLHTMLVIDEAELVLPAGAAKVPSKEPLQDLLKRAQTAGLGIVLASQNPAELEHRNAEISTWFLGRIRDERAIEQMNGLLDRGGALLRSKLPRLELGRFVMLRDRKTTDLERAPPLLRAEPLSEAELLALAAETDPRRQTGAASPQLVS